MNGRVWTPARIAEDPWTDWNLRAFSAHVAEHGRQPHQMETNVKSVKYAALRGLRGVKWVKRRDDLPSGEIDESP